MYQQRRQRLFSALGIEMSTHGTYGEGEWEHTNTPTKRNACLMLMVA